MALPAVLSQADFAEADPKLSILVIESGPNNFGDPMVTVPAFWLSHTDPSDKYTWSYKASASNYLGGRESIVPAGRIVRAPEISDINPIRLLMLR